MEDDIYNKIKADKRIDMITPQLVSTVFDPDRVVMVADHFMPAKDIRSAELQKRLARAAASS